VIVVRLALVVLAAVAFAQENRPAFQPFRYDENWSFLADGSRRTDWLDRLKYIPLGPSGWFVSLGGELRERFELLDQPGFGTGPVDQTGYFLQRYLLSSDFHFGSRFRFFMELQSGLEEGRNGGPRPTDLDRLDFHQGFVDWNISSGEAHNVTLRIGRQELGFGSGRLIAPAEGLNLRRSLDGARITVKSGKWVWSASALRLVQSLPGFFDDVPDHAQTFWGAGFTAPSRFGKGANFAGYYLGIDRKKAIFEKGTGRAIRQTIGTHWWKSTSPWNYNYEGVFQWGSFRGAPIRAWALSADTGYTFQDLRFQPRFGFRSDVASGDGGAKNGALGSFDPLFPAIPVYSGPSGILGPTNLMDATPSMRLQLRRDLSMTLESSTFWRESLTDGVYSPFITPIRIGTASQGRYVATAPSVSAAWQASRHTSCTLIYTRFFTGAFFREARPAHDVNYLTVWVTYRF
jgi:hypothetical protein